MREYQYRKLSWEPHPIRSDRFSVSDVEKLIHPRPLLAGEAAKAISGPPISTDNYEIALETLKTLYGNKQLIISAANEALRSLIRPSDMKPVNLGKTFNEVQNLLATIKLSGDDA